MAPESDQCAGAPVNFERNDESGDRARWRQRRLRASSPRIGLRSGEIAIGLGVRRLIHPDHARSTHFGFRAPRQSGPGGPFVGRFRRFRVGQGLEEAIAPVSSLALIGEKQPQPRILARELLFVPSRVVRGERGATARLNLSHQNSQPWLRRHRPLRTPVERPGRLLDPVTCLLDVSQPGGVATRLIAVRPRDLRAARLRRSPEDRIPIAPPGAVPGRQARSRDRRSLARGAMQGFPLATIAGATRGQRRRLPSIPADTAGPRARRPRDQSRPHRVPGSAQRCSRQPNVAKDARSFPRPRRRRWSTWATRTHRPRSSTG